MKITHCYACGSNQHSFYAEENGFALVKCNGCGLLFLENRPDDDQITQAHQQGKHGGAKELDVTGRYHPHKIHHYLEVLRDLYDGEIGKKTWLDIGCGHGEFMEAVQKYSSQPITVKGTDPNIHKQESARKRGLDVGYFSIDTHDEQYDIISMLNVYSHLPDPPKFLKMLRRLLTPGGELILETGDTAGFTPKEHYRPFYLPDHLSFASESIIVKILKRLDFEILRIKKYPFVRLDLFDISKEVVKAILPNRPSNLRYYLRMKTYSQTDMFIRAKIKN